MKKTRKNLFTYSLNHFFTSPNAFTLTEVLVALTIVGVISALVLPAIITKYQNKAFDSAYKRETQVIESAVDELVVSENTASFFDTMMYKDVEPENYDDSSKVFVNKYLRASKICSTGSDCFAKKYYTYEDNDKKVYVPEFKGTCAKLKNGASICITPQIGGVPIKGIIDINGDKGPNVLNKDLRTFAFTTWTRNGKNNEVAEVKDNDFTPIGTTDPCKGMTCGCGDLPPCPGGTDPCAGLTCGCGNLPPCGSGGSCGNPDPSNSARCCDTATITDAYDSCCTISGIANNNAACQIKTANIKFMITGKYTSSAVNNSVQLYVNNGPIKKSIVAEMTGYEEGFSSRVTRTISCTPNSVRYCDYAHSHNFITKDSKTISSTVDTKYSLDINVYPAGKKISSCTIEYPIYLYRSNSNPFFEGFIRYNEDNSGNFLNCYNAGKTKYLNSP